jgi:hypothetical protein
MTVYKIGRKKLKITLTDSEVISFFGTYRGLDSVNNEARLAVGLLLKKSLSEYDTELDGRLLVEIRARENAGCVITVSSAESSRRNLKGSTIMFEFADTAALIGGAVRLYKSRFFEGSSLYKMPHTYRLIVTARGERDFYFMNEFCLRKSDSDIEAAYTKEHGRLICEKNAVERLGRAFI